jgi:general stress protein 26
MSQSDPRDVIWKQIRKIGTCMLVTFDGAHLRARPMRGIAEPDANAIWFITDANSANEDAMARFPDACLAFTETRDQNYVSISGTAGREHDHAHLARLWNEGAEAYFPRGKDDPSVALLKFTPAKGEYWDAPSNPIVLAIKFLQAKLTAERPDLGTHEQTSLP